MSADPNPSAARALPASSLAPLRHPVFCAMWLAGSVCFLGLWMQNVEDAWTIASLISSPLMRKTPPHFWRRFRRVLKPNWELQ